MKEDMQRDGKLKEKTEKAWFDDSKELAEYGISVFVSSSEITDECELTENLREEWQDFCAERIVPSERTLCEVVGILKSRYDVEEKTVSEEDRMSVEREYYVNQLMREDYVPHGELMKLTEEPNRKPSEEEIAAAVKKDREREEELLRKATKLAEVSDMRFKIYNLYFPSTQKNKILFEEDLLEQTRMAQQFAQSREHMDPEEMNPAEIRMLRRREPAPEKFEGFSVQLTDTGSLRGGKPGSGALIREVIRLMGISAEDVASRNNRFQSYVSHLTRSGELPTLEEYQKMGSGKK